MKFSHRLAYYLLGLMIGGIFLKFVLTHTSGKGLEFDYLPNARVLKNIRNKPFDFSEVAVLKMNQQGIDTTDLKTVLTNGDVDFDKSNLPEAGGKLYEIEGVTAKNKTVILQIVNFENKALLKDILSK
jgi:Domain of unknown function (DUF4258)